MQHFLCEGPVRGTGPCSRTIWGWKGTKVSLQGVTKFGKSQGDACGLLADGWGSELWTKAAQPQGTQGYKADSDWTPQMSQHLLSRGKKHTFVRSENKASFSLTH